MMMKKERGEEQGLPALADFLLSFEPYPAYVGLSDAVQYEEALRTAGRWARQLSEARPNNDPNFVQEEHDYFVRRIKDYITWVGFLVNQKGYDASAETLVEALKWSVELLNLALKDLPPESGTSESSKTDSKDTQVARANEESKEQWRAILSLQNTTIRLERRIETLESAMNLRSYLKKRDDERG
jgi:hypothetical protein